MNPGSHRGRFLTPIVLLSGLAALLSVLYTDLVLVMPIVLFEDLRGRAAMRESRARVGGARLRIGAILLSTTQQLLTVTISSEVNVLVLGVMLVLFVVGAPEGIIGLIRKLRGNRGEGGA